MLNLELSNGSIIKCSEPSGVVRGQRANQIWYPFIDKEGNGCVTNVLTGESYLDWTNEELEENRNER